MQRCLIFLILSFSCVAILTSCSHSEKRFKRDLSSDDRNVVWKKASQGEHSFKALGDEFLVPLKMKKVEGAKLSLFNERVAKQLGFHTPESRAELEKLVLENFSYMVSDDQSEHAEKEWFATKYQDSKTKTEGGAMGDGRAGWSGHIPVKLENGDILEVDVVVKGIGPTPLAWINHSDAGHSDGLQSIDKAIHSFVVSEANAKNNLDTTVDLAVIELPIKKVNTKSGEEIPAALTIRVGHQTRNAHLRFHYDSPENFKKIFEYIVRRDLNLDGDVEIDKSIAKKFLRQYTMNLAEENAYYYDLMITHGSLTAGNRTTKGSSIDLSTMRYHSGHHAKFKHTKNKSTMGGQKEKLKVYIKNLIVYMRKSEIGFGFGKATRESLEKEYDKVFEEKLTRLWLLRLGLNEEDIEQLRPSVKKEFFTTTTELFEKFGLTKKNVSGQNIKPAAFDMRKIMKNALLTHNLVRNGDELAFEELFHNQEDWGTLSKEQSAPYARRFQNSVDGIIREIFEGEVPDSRLERASKHSVDSPFRTNTAIKEFEQNIFEKIVSGEWDYKKASSESFGLADSLVDPGMEGRTLNNLGKTYINAPLNPIGLGTNSCQDSMRALILGR